MKRMEIMKRKAKISAEKSDEGEDDFEDDAKDGEEEKTDLVGSEEGDNDRDNVDFAAIITIKKCN